MYRILFLVMMVTALSAQSKLDVIRASNYYSKAKSAYRSGSYRLALSHLANAEKNLKGKTNKDLEYLKIMANYRIKNYKQAYTLLTEFFETGYKSRWKSFENVKSYRKEYNVDYEDALTNIFVELEKKYGIVTDSGAQTQTLASLVKRVAQQLPSYSKLVRECYGPDANRKVKTYKTQRYNRVTRKYKRSSQKSVKYVLNVNLKASKLSVQANYSQHADVTYDIRKSTSITTSGITRSIYLTNKKFDFSKGRLITHSSNVSNRQDRVYWDGDEVLSRSDQMRVLKNVYNRLKILRKTSAEFRIRFTENEQLILQQGNNLQKFKDALNQELRNQYKL